MTIPQIFLDGRVTLHSGDCLDILRSLPDVSIDSVVCDPPYHLTSIIKRFGKSGSAEAKPGKTGAFKRASAGFMGKEWDGGDIAFRPEVWAECLRVLKPGGHLLAFSGTRTYHRMACAIEDAGFEVRDQIGWTYGSGFPKSHNVGDGWGTALKPAWEPICMARKAVVGTVAGNMCEHGVGGLNIEACRVSTSDKLSAGAGKLWSHYREGEASAERRYGDQGSTDFAMKPGPRGGDPDGRWPANLIHDGSDEVLAAFPDSAGQQGDVRGTEASQPFGGHVYGEMKGRHSAAKRGDGGSAARFFYTAKADADDRLGSKHPTVKPLNLMQWLVRLVTPVRGVVLDPFAGTGTTGEAAWREGMSAVLIEREAEYQADIARRMDLADKPMKRAAVAATKNNLAGAEGTPLFGGEAA